MWKHFHDDNKIIIEVKSWFMMQEICVNRSVCKEENQRIKFVLLAFLDHDEDKNLLIVNSCFFPCNLLKLNSGLQSKKNVSFQIRTIMEE